jgi:hypothetical protein
MGSPAKFIKTPIVKHLHYFINSYCIIWVKFNIWYYSFMNFQDSINLLAKDGVPFFFIIDNFRKESSI